MAQLARRPARTRLPLAVAALAVHTPSRRSPRCRLLEPLPAPRYGCSRLCSPAARTPLLALLLVAGAIRSSHINCLRAHLCPPAERPRSPRPGAARLRPAAVAARVAKCRRRPQTPLPLPQFLPGHRAPRPRLSAPPACAALSLTGARAPATPVPSDPSSCSGRRPSGPWPPAFAPGSPPSLGQATASSTGAAPASPFSHAR
nr:vegetative cell wall protein gp1-like [Aegilops tauschii subsp. strangulata]